MTLPLKGIRILDLTRAVAGPYATMLLGDFGAEIIKIEDPQGDISRTLGPPFLSVSPDRPGESAYFLSVNRNKKSIVLDLKTEQGKAIFKTMARDADIVIENFSPGTMSRLGLSLHDLRKSNPRLITCSITGYGSEGMYADRRAYDFVIQAETGLMSITGEPDGPPMKFGIAITDITTAMMATIALLVALQKREQTGWGEHVELSLYETVLSWLINVGANYLATGKPPRRYGNAHPNITPYQLFRTRDGYYAYSGGGDHHFKKMCEILGVPELAKDSRFATNPQRLQHRDELIPILEEKFLTKTTQEWDDTFRRAGIPGGKVNRIDQVLESDYVKERGMIWEITHKVAGKIKVIGNPIRFSEIPLERKEPPPLLGEHTDEVLKQLGYSEAEIDQFRRQGVTI